MTTSELKSNPETPPQEDREKSKATNFKREREDRGLTLRQLSERTRISVHMLSAIEAENFEQLPPARVYVRGFVKCIAEEIGLEANRVATAYADRWEKWFDRRNLTDQSNHHHPGLKRAQ